MATLGQSHPTDNLVGFERRCLASVETVSNVSRRLTIVGWRSDYLLLESGVIALRAAATLSSFTKDDDEAAALALLSYFRSTSKSNSLRHITSNLNNNERSRLLHHLHCP